MSENSKEYTILPALPDFPNEHYRLCSVRTGVMTLWLRVLLGYEVLHKETTGSYYYYYY